MSSLARPLNHILLCSVPPKYIPALPFFLNTSRAFALKDKTVSVAPQWSKESLFLQPRIWCFRVSLSLAFTSLLLSALALNAESFHYPELALSCLSLMNIILFCKLMLLISLLVLFLVVWICMLSILSFSSACTCSSFPFYCGKDFCPGRKPLRPLIQELTAAS